jgi:hypothetical protein
MTTAQINVEASTPLTSEIAARQSLFAVEKKGGRMALPFPEKHNKPTHD